MKFFKGGDKRLKYYKTQKAKDGTIYSCDMVRLKFKSKEQDNVCDFMQRFSDGDIEGVWDIQYFRCLNEFRYRHLWQVKNNVDGYSFAIAYAFNGPRNSWLNGWIEFNPNKCMISTDFRKFLDNLNLHLVDSDLVRWDLAIDIPLVRDCASLHREKPMTYHRIVDSRGSVTEYLGIRNNEGFVKLYDKTKESKLDYDLTRLEITLEKKSSIDTLFPSVSLVDGQQTLICDPELNENDIILIQALRTSERREELFSRMSRYKRKKIEPYLADRVLLLDKSCYLFARDIALSFEL